MRNAELLIVLIYVVGFCTSFLWYAHTEDEVQALLAIIIIAACASLGIVTFVNWLFYQYTQHLYNLNRAHAISRESELALNLAMLNHQQLEAFQTITEGSAAADPYQSDDVVWISNVPVPNDFVRKVIAGSHGKYLLPMRTFSDGSAERLYYNTVVNYLVDVGLAEPARGNKPAKVENWQQVISRLSDNPEN